MYCGNCGGKVPEGVLACSSCGFPPRIKKNFCFGCGSDVLPQQLVCEKCDFTLEEIREDRDVESEASIEVGQSPANQIDECNECGAELAAGGKYCSSCGSAITLSGKTSAASEGKSDGDKKVADNEDIELLSMMTAQDSIETCLEKYFDFSGRASRAEFWWFWLAASVLSISLDVLDSSGTLSTILTFAVIIPLLAVGARRLHDTGRSGWWQLLSITVVGMIPLMVLWALEGAQEDNDYGGSPMIYVDE